MDHAQGVATFSKRHNTPVWMTAGTASAMPAIARVQHLSGHRPLTLGAIGVQFIINGVRDLGVV